MCAIRIKELMVKDKTVSTIQMIISLFTPNIEFLIQTQPLFVMGN